jgi:hypothetical protein
MFLGFGFGPAAKSKIVSAFNATAYTNPSSPLFGLACQTGEDDYNCEVLDSPYTQGVARTNSLFIAAATIHLFSALQCSSASSCPPGSRPRPLPLARPSHPTASDTAPFFADSLVWPFGGHVDPKTGRRYSFFVWMQYPEFLNILGAALYLYTANAYAKKKVTGPGRFLDGDTLAIHKVDAAAAVVELAASFGWLHVWWVTHERGPGRGLTLDDPEFIALALLASAYLLYVPYNAVVVAQPASYFGNPALGAVFQSGDVLYFVGAFMFLLVSFRDSGFFNSLGMFARLRAAGGGEPPAKPPAAGGGAPSPSKAALMLATPLRTSDNPLRVAVAAEPAGAALARQVAAVRWEAGAGDLPPGWDFEPAPGGGYVFVTPAGARVEADPRADFELYVGAFEDAGRRGIALEGYL